MVWNKCEALTPTPLLLRMPCPARCLSANQYTIARPSCRSLYRITGDFRLISPTPFLEAPPPRPYERGVLQRCAQRGRCKEN